MIGRWSVPSWHFVTQRDVRSDVGCQGLGASECSCFDAIFRDALANEIFFYGLHPLLRKGHVCFRITDVVGMAFQLNDYLLIVFHHQGYLIQLFKGLRFNMRFCLRENKMV